MSDHPLEARWRAVRAAGRAALIPYFTAGYPAPESCVAALRLAEAAGADMVEVGIPFSDPLADGPTIQRATQAALDQGVTVARVLEMVRAARLGIPVVLMTYVNPVLAYGLPRFLADAHGAGASGLLLTDLPAGSDPAMEGAVAASPLALIRLVAPTTSAARLAEAVRGARGFVYFISRLGVTGARAEAPPDLEAQVRRIRAVTPLPIAVGFGISTPAQAAAAARVADGVVVGSALVDALRNGAATGTGQDAAGALLRELAGAVRSRGAGVPA